MRTIILFCIIISIISCKKNEELNVAPIDNQNNNTNWSIDSLPIDFVPPYFSSDTLESPASDYVNINCIERIQPQGGDYDTNTINTNNKISRIQYLMQRNNLDFTKWLYFNYDYYSIRGIQFYNNLPVYTSNVVYIFDNNDNLQFTNNLSLVSSISLDTTSSLTLDYLLNLYNYSLSKDMTYNRLRINCITAEFGYYNINAGYSYARINMQKVWKLFPKGKQYSTQYPVLFVNDTNGKRISYFNGTVR